MITCQQVTQEFLKYLYEAKSGSRDPQYQEEREEEEVPYTSAEEVVSNFKKIINICTWG